MRLPITMKMVQDAFADMYCPDLDADHGSECPANVHFRAACEQFELAIQQETWQQYSSLLKERGIEPLNSPYDPDCSEAV